MSDEQTNELGKTLKEGLKRGAYAQIGGQAANNSSIYAQQAYREPPTSLASELANRKAKTALLLGQNEDERKRLQAEYDDLDRAIAALSPAPSEGDALGEFMKREGAVKHDGGPLDLLADATYELLFSDDKTDIDTGAYYRNPAPDPSVLAYRIISAPSEEAGKGEDALPKFAGVPAWANDRWENDPLIREFMQRPGATWHDGKITTLSPEVRVEVYFDGDVFVAEACELDWLDFECAYRVLTPAEIEKAEMIAALERGETEIVPPAEPSPLAKFMKLPGAVLWFCDEVLTTEGPGEIGATIEFIRRDGTIKLQEVNDENRKLTYWWHDGVDGDIIAYRVLPSEPAGITPEDLGDCGTPATAAPLEVTINNFDPWAASRAAAEIVVGEPWPMPEGEGELNLIDYALDLAPPKTSPPSTEPAPLFPPEPPPAATPEQLIEAGAINGEAYGLWRKLATGRRPEDAC